MAGNGSLFDLTGRVAAVTGGNRGIGRAMALGLARAGAAVAVLARDAKQNELILAEMKDIGKPALVLPLDVTNRSALTTAVADIERTLGGIDILIHNAGVVTLTGGVLKNHWSDRFSRLSRSGLRHRHDASGRRWLFDLLEADLFARQSGIITKP